MMVSAICRLCAVFSEVLKMRNIHRAIIPMLVIAAFLLISCSRDLPPQPVKATLRRPDEAFLKYGEDHTSYVELNKINSSVWTHTSYRDSKGSLEPSNGLVVLTDEGLVLIDTPWTDNQMESLDKLCKESFNVGFKEAIITHAHEDRMGGGNYLKKHNIRINSLKRVSDNAARLGFVEPDNILEGDHTVVSVDDTDFELFFPGEGHTVDNTVVWIERYNLLFAGCMVIEQGVTSLGNIGEANLDEWPNALNTILERYEDIAVVVPGHGQWGDKSLVEYTLGLFEE